MPAPQWRTRAAEDAFWWWFVAEGSELTEVFYDAELAIFFLMHQFSDRG
jgi:hypothetical protein